MGQNSSATVAVGEPKSREVVHPHAAGIDVGNGAHYVAVRPDPDPQPVRRFECFTADLYRLANWLQNCGVQTVALQSTGVYWIPLNDILEERGFEVYLVNARHTKSAAYRFVRRRSNHRSLLVDIDLILLLFDSIECVLRSHRLHPRSAQKTSYFQGF